jgi:hypothetical protein
MRLLNSIKKKTIIVFYKNSTISISLLFKVRRGEWVRIFKIPDGSFIGQAEMDSPNDWEFVFSYLYI